MSKISNTRTQTGTLLRCLTILLAASSVLAICTKAQAGSFTTTYSGGATATPSYALQTNGLYGAESLGYSSKTVSLSAPITANFTWVPNPSFPNNDPEPKIVIIQQYSTAEWVNSEGYAPIGSGSCDNGLGSATTPTLNFSGTVGGQSAGYKYTLDSGDTISCSPSASFVGWLGYADVGYQAVPCPITIGVNGAVQDSSGNWDILVGQQCTASLQGVPSGCTVSDYQWSVSGTTIQGWSPSTPAGFLGFGANPDASYEVDGTGPLTNATASWFWNDQGMATEEAISCTATVTPPSGEGAPINVSASAVVWVYRPYMASACAGGMLAIFQSANQNNDWLYGAYPAADGETGGMDFTAELEAPTLSPISSWNTNFGSLFLVQLVTPNVQYEASSGTWWKNGDYGQEGLDATCPYGWVSYVNNPAGAIKYMTRDSPDIDLTLTGAVAARLTDGFQDYLMYTPPPCGNNFVQCVPLGYFNWSTSGSVAIPSSGYWAEASPAGQVIQENAGFTPTNTFPSWQNVSTASAPFVQE